MPQRTLITSALPYANGYIHLGHCAGAYLPADIYARFLRLSGEDVLYVCGSDEHGVAITIAADKEKVTPKDIIDKYHNANKSAFDKFGMTFDIYSRTSGDHHHKVAREFFSDFLKKGYLVARDEEQLYDEESKMFLPDRYVEGTCPNCGNESARGDQCDNCGAYYNQTELKNPKSLISGKTPSKKTTKHWYFKFGEFQQFLEEYIKSNENLWKDNVIQQTRSWLKAGLTDRAITRDLDWGVKLSGIEGIDDSEVTGKVLYVWFDAVLGYISNTQEYFAQLGKPEEWRKWWQDAGTDYIAFIGKDNIVFHTLIFPAMLHGRTDGENKYILPKNVPANEFLNLQGQKFSKSRNWSIDLQDFTNEFTNPIMTDVLRYTLTMNLPENKDADFSWYDFQARNNNELAAIYGNFVNRTLQFLFKNFEGKVPEFSNREQFKNEWLDYLNEKDTTLLSDNDKLLLDELAKHTKQFEKNLREFKHRDSLTSVMSVARAANKYFNDEEPWKSIKNDRDQCAKTLFVCCQILRSLSILFSPYLPNSSKYLQEILGESVETGETISSENRIQNVVFPKLEVGKQIQEPKIIFGRIENDFVEAQVAKLGDKKTEEAKPIEDLIAYEDFMKTKLRTAKVISAEAVPKSKKLLKLQVELGDEKRQIIAGIAEHYSPEEIIGQTVVIVANLKPAKIMGLESQGMILAASNSDGKLSFVSPKVDVGSGAEVR